MNLLFDWHNLIKLHAKDTQTLLSQKYLKA